MLVFLIFLVAAVLIAGGILGHIAARQRRAALAALAARLGLGFSEEEDHATAERLRFLRQLDTGSNRYVCNRMSGEFQGEEVMAADFHYETHTQTKHGRQTQHHHLTILTLRLPRSFPELLITPEGLFSKIAQALGYEDIDFESAEFSRAFCVRCRDKKLAYDVCHPLMMEYLLAHRDLAIEFEQDVLALTFDTRLEVPQIEGRLRQLVEIRRLLPGYILPPA